MKRLLTTIMAAVTLSTAAFADDYSLYLEPTEGGMSEWTVASLSKLTFNNGNIVFTATDGTVNTMPIAGVKRLFFSTPEIQGIGTTEADSDNASWDGSILHTGMPTGTAATVYSTTGAVVARTAVEANGIVRLDACAKGMYIVNINGKNFKIFKP